MEGDNRIVEVEVEAATRIHKSYQFMKKTLQFLVLVSFFSCLYSYFSGFPFFFSYNLQFSTLVFPLLAQALDRKYMFLICNGILAVLAKNLRLSSSSLNMKSAEDSVKEITQLPLPIKEETTVEENVASMECAATRHHVAVADEKQSEQEHEYHYGDFRKDGIILESEGWEEEEEDEDGLEESRVAEGTSATEQVIDASVSTEELNKKFEEFIRKMKEEIRVEAQQQLITV
ncbi:uncharacterized protein LOC105175241 [Sesamum indicum]|uniref:Uncharacterized protein LOC105175241 n=1 Tax=Sesamum indicum TaxID=4182 RepID=A0A6I9UD10_SESIN|nr:uncharacterized protein LOC105175241 [Sesamum indicum]